MALAGAVLAGCGEGPDETVGAQEGESVETSFDRHLVLPDEALLDPDAMTAAQIQTFLEDNPYGTRSVLADHIAHGITAAQAIRNASNNYGISPVILLARLQLEQSLVAKTSATNNRLNWAMGCGCPDGGGCISAFKGFDRQVDCAAERFSTYVKELYDNGSTIAGWGVFDSRTTLDGYTITPRNHHTAALYTYTPWMSSAKNFLQIYRKFADYLEYHPPAPEGCPSATYPSGITVQLRPDAIGLGDLVGAPDGTCLLDTNVVVDHEAIVTHAPNAKLSPNFRLSEFASASSMNRMLLSPALVEAMQKTREELNGAITVVAAFTTPDDLDELCEGPSDPLCIDGELTQGTGALVRSSAGNQALLQAASEAGVPTCWAHGGEVYLGVGEALGCPR